jgi:hypothetical protein
MRTVVYLLGAAALLAAISTHAAILTWTNTAGGDWNVAANWNPSQVPVNGDDVIITNGGTYTVTNTGSVTLNNLTLGGTNGTQILMVNSLTLTNLGLLNSNGVLNWNGGDLEGAVTVAQGGTLVQSNTLQFAFNNYAFGYTNTAYLSNFGTVLWTGTIQASANTSTHSGGGLIYNAGLWNAVSDMTMGIYSGSGTNYFINTGTLEKSGGTGTSTLGWSFSSSGIIQTLSGTFNLNWGGPSVLHGNLTLSGTLGAPLTVASNAVLNLSSGDLESALTVAQGGTLTASNTVNLAYNNYALGYTNTAYLTNYGTVVWAGTINGYGNSSANAGGGVIYNAGLWQSIADSTIALGNGYGVSSFINTSTLQKTGGTATSAINWGFSNNGGTINTPSGAFSMGNWIGNGVVHGSATFSSGTITGTLASDCVVNFSSTVTGTMMISSNAVANWSGGDLEGALTVAQGGTLTISNTIQFAYNNYAFAYTNTAYLTNYGTVLWAGSIQASANSTHGGGGFIYNAGLWNAVSDMTMGVYSGSGTNYFINTGTLEKTAAAGTSTISWNFSSTGTIQTFSGTFNLNWGGPSILHGTLTLSGTISTPLTVASNAVLNLSGADLESWLTVAQGGTLTLSNTLQFAYNNYAFAYTNTAYLTNYGTVLWAGAIQASANSSTHGGGGVIYNAGLWNAVSDMSMGTYSGSGTNYFINTGTLEKTGGTGTSTIGWNFNSGGGALQTLSGYFTFSGNWNAASLVYGNATISGNIAGIIGSNATMAWLGGDLEGALTVAQGGTLIQSNTLQFAYNNYAFGYTNTAYLTNYGTVLWAGTIQASGNGSTHGGGGFIYNAGLWNAVSDMTMGSYNGVGTNYFNNTGTLQKTAGAGTSTVSWQIENSGVIGSQTNTLSLAGNYDLSAGTLDFGINNSNNFGIITLSGTPATLAGTASANFNNGYVAATGSSFPVLTYSSRSGLFTNFNLPFAVAWQTNYGSTVFTLTVLNVRPTLAAIPLQTVDELTQLNVTASATDPDAGQSLTFAPVSVPGGMSINSSTGAIAWTPAQTQSPATNTVLVSVTDNGTPPLSATNSFTVIVIEVNVPPSLPTIATQTVNELTLLTVTDTATNFNIHSTNTSYTLINPPSGMSISAGGIITWTPSQTQSPGTNIVTAVVTNSNPYDQLRPNLTSTNSFTVIVKEVNVPPSLPAISAQTVNELTSLTVTNTATNSNIHSTIIGYTLVAPPSNMVVSASGVITWTPAQAQSPATNLITTIVTNSNPYDLINPRLTSTNTFTVIVKEVNQVPSLPVISPQTATLLQPFAITNTATEPNIHSTNAGYQLVAPPAGMTISSSGVISWTPAANQTLTTNTVTTVVTNGNPYDSVNPRLTATNSFQISVLPNLTVTSLTHFTANGTNLGLTWPADHTGWRLLIQTNPLSKGLGTNWATFPGSTATNQEIIPFMPTNAAVFFRMAYP